MTNESSPLNGIKIVDLSRVLSGPFATMTLADLGADVVKVERPGTGDDTRSFGPPFVAGASTYFLSVNRGKRSICLDLKAEADREVLKRLVACADVVVENFRPGVMERLGLDYARLKAEHPALIMCSISGFGQAKGGPGYDLMVQGLSGIPSITGAGDLPTKCGASIADLVAGMNAVQGILAALVQRERTGKGSFVDVSMLDGQLSLLTYHASAWLNGGQAPKAIGNAHPSIHPFCAYAAQDQHFNLAVGNDKLFVQLCEALGLDLHLNCLFENNADRVKNRSALNAILGPVFLAQPAEYWLELLKQAGVPCGPILSVEQALKAATLTTHAHPSAEGLVQTVALPFSVGDAPRSSERGAPALGGDQQEVLKDWLGEP
jgi:crotonobetainyl-CoA:carnitine CoA-transferase CaiB-like acyl-CoA transferase